MVKKWSINVASYNVRIGRLENGDFHTNYSVFKHSVFPNKIPVLDFKALNVLVNWLAAKKIKNAKGLIRTVKKKLPTVCFECLEESLGRIWFDFSRIFF